MLNSKNLRELCYLVKIDNILPIEGSDNCECAVVGGWNVMVKKNTFKPGDIGIYFEIDSKVDSTNEVFAFLEKRHYKVKTQKYSFGGKGRFISQGLLMAPSDFGWENCDGFVKNGSEIYRVDDESRFLTEKLKVVYSVEEDNKRKARSADPNAKYKSMMARHPKLARSAFGRWSMKHLFMKKILYFFLGNNKKDVSKEWPTGRFPGVSKTDQERCENMPYILNDKTPYIVTEKCDGSSGTYILERKGKNKFEFYVCSRNVRMKDKEQECFYGAHNYYWEVAEKYKIEEKMKEYLLERPDITFVCWQGEICAPGIQKNPHFLKETHFFCFHWTDSLNGRLDIRVAKELWDKYDMETVPIVNTNYVFPDDFEEFKQSADGFYSLSVTGDQKRHPREGFVYYSTARPDFSFKNVSREYLLKH